MAVYEQDADRIRIAGDAIDRLGLVWLGLTNQLTVAVAVAPALEVVANALADATRAGGAFQTSISFLGDNIGRISSIALVFASFFAGRWVVALAAAALGVRGLATALVILRGALIRTGIGALIVGAGELVNQFSKTRRGRWRVWRSTRAAEESGERGLGPHRPWHRRSGRYDRKLVTL